MVEEHQRTGARSRGESDCAADELLDHPAVPTDDRAALGEVAGQQLADLLRIPTLGQRGEADQVSEQDGGAAPHRPQNRPVSSKAPQEGQACAAGRSLDR